MTILDGISASVATAAAGLSLVALWRLRKRPAPAAPDRAPPVLLIRPVETPSETELENLNASVAYPGPLEQIVVGPDVMQLPLRDGRVVSHPTCANRKVGHVLAALARPRASETVVIVADADVRVDGALIRSLVAALGEGGGLAMAALEPEEGPTFSHALLRATLRETHQDFEVVHRLAVGAVPLCGKVNALSPAAVALLPRCAQAMSEDLAFGELLHQHGLSVHLAHVRARMPAASGLTPAKVFGRFVRWMQVLRVQRPGLHATVPLLIAPGPALVASLPFLGFAARGAVLGFVLARSALALRLGAKNPLRWMLGEAVLLGAFAVSLFRRRIVWRGRAYPVRRELSAPTARSAP